MQRSSLPIASILLLTLIGTMIFSNCKKKENDDSSTTTLLAGLLLASSSSTLTGSCNKFSVNSTCDNYYGSSGQSTCIAQSGTYSTTRCSALTNFGSCRTTGTERVYYSGGTGPLCSSTGTCQTNCTSILGTYGSTYN